MPNRVEGGFSPPTPTAPRMRVRTPENALNKARRVGKPKRTPPFLGGAALEIAPLTAGGAKDTARRAG
jgi:hypothetical protein